MAQARKQTASPSASPGVSRGRSGGTARLRHTLLPLACELEKFKEHLARRTWQNVRYEQHLALLSSFSTAAGIPAVFLVFDYKEKVAAEMKLREV